MKKIFLLIIGFALFFLGTLQSSAFYTSANHYFGTVTDSISMTIPIKKLSNETISVSSYSVQGGTISAAPTINNISSNDTNIVIVVSGIKRKSLVSLEVTDTVSGLKKTFFFRILSSFNSFTAPTFTHTKTNDTVNLIVNDAEKTFLDSDRAYKAAGTGYNYLVSDNGGSFTYGIRRDDTAGVYFLAKMNKSFEVINEYEIIFQNPTGGVTSNPSFLPERFTNLFVLGPRVFLDYFSAHYVLLTDASGDIVVSSDGKVVFRRDAGIAFGAGKILNSIYSSGEIPVVGNKIIQRGKFIYSLNGTTFKVDYMTGNSYDASGLRNLLTQSVPNGTNSFYILDNSVILTNKTTGAVGIINADFILYQYLNDDLSPINLDRTLQNNVPYPIKNLITKTVAGVAQGEGATRLTTTSDFASIATAYQVGGKSGTEKFLNTSLLEVELNPTNINKYSYSKTLRAYKISSLTTATNSLYGDLVGSTTIAGDVALLGYGMLLEQGEVCTRTNQVPINTPVTAPKKVFEVKEGNYCLYVTGYDIAMNNTGINQVLLTGGSPIRVIGGIVSFNDFEIQRNTIGDELKNVDFYINSTKELKNLTVTYDTKSGSTITKSFVGAGVDKIFTIASGGNFKYSFTVQASTLSPSTNFNISGEDYFGITGNSSYQYDLYKGYYQVVGLTQTDTGISGDINKNQAKKGFMYGVSSGNSSNIDEVNSLFFFNKNSNNQVVIPTKTVSGNVVADKDILKFSIKDFRKRSERVFNPTPNETFVFGNTFYYSSDTDLALSTIKYYGNGILLVSGDLFINGDIIKNITSETKAYENSLKIFVTGDIQISPNVKLIDASLFSNGKITSNSNIDLDTFLSTP